MSSDPIISHGRGGNIPLQSRTLILLFESIANASPPHSGAGNIERDEKAYADGEIVREGPLGDRTFFLFLDELSSLVLKLSHKTCLGSKKTFLLPRFVLQYSFPASNKRC